MSEETMSATPALDKMREANDKGSQQIGEFLDWLTGQGLMICAWHEREAVGDTTMYTPSGWYPIREPIEKMLARYFDVDLDAVEKEKRTLLEALREAHKEES